MLSCQMFLTLVIMFWEITSKTGQAGNMFIGKYLLILEAKDKFDRRDRCHVKYFNVAHYSKTIKGINIKL